MKHLLGNADRLVVVDVETTGVYNSDRILEVATVTLDRDGEVLDEWDTLIDPERDVGPVHIHRVTASMVSAAPRFVDVAGALARRLDGAVLVAHNISFDVRMLRNEFARLDATFQPGSGVCTLRITGTRLVDACQRYRITHHAHRALGDARACAELLRRTATEPAITRPALAACATAPATSRTLRRDHFPDIDAPMPYAARLATQLHHYGESGATLAYLDMLDWALADLSITPQERAELQELADDLALSPAEVTAAHARYLEELVAAATRDEVVTDPEMEVLTKVTIALGLDLSSLDAMVASWRGDTGDPISLVPGLRVCFTGTATYPDGQELPRKTLEELAHAIALVPVGTVSKSGCDLLVAADPATSSGKAGKARKYGIPIASVADFLRAQEPRRVPANRTSLDPAR